MRALWNLTWLEIKIFLREPMGVFGTVGMPVLVFMAITRVMENGRGVPRRMPRAAAALFDVAFVPVLASMLIAIGAVISLVTIVSIYRDGGILKRLRATPLRPYTILTAHVLVKLLFTFITSVLLIAAGRRYYPAGAEFPVADFVLALIFATWSILSIGFLIASVVPTARVAQPLAAAIMYPMLAASGLFVPFDVLPERVAAVARRLPLSHAVSLLTGVWHGDGWAAHRADLVGLIATFAICTAVSSWMFRWE